MNSPTTIPQSIALTITPRRHPPEEMRVITKIINVRLYIEILEFFFFMSLIENWFGDDEVIFQDENSSGHKAKCFKAFLQKRLIESKAWPVNSPNLNPIEHLWRLFKKKSPSWPGNNYTINLNN